MGRASAVGRASDVAVEWEGLVLTWHGKGAWEGRMGGAPPETTLYLHLKKIFKNNIIRSS